MFFDLLATLFVPLFSQQLQLIYASSIPEYDPEFVRFAFDHAAAAYSVNPLKCIGRYNGTQIIRHSAVSCDHFHDQCLYYISASPQYIIVAFGGTRSKFQLMVEILASMAEPKVRFIAGGSVQRYFNRAFKSIWHGMWCTVNKLIQEDRSRPVLFTGHSLGGAIASLASTRFAYFCLRKMLDVDIRLITFGSPRVGNRDYAFAHDALVPYSFRIVHRGDLVPHLPGCYVNLRTFACISRFSFGPYHHGLEIWYPENMTDDSSLYRICLGKPRNEDRTCSDSYYRHYNARDHLYYYDEHVSLYGIAGCVPEQVQEQIILRKKSVMRNTIK